MAQKGERKHWGELTTDSSFYKKWSYMKSRTSGAPLYTDKGISVCDAWKEFENFISDMYDSFKEHVSLYGERDTTLDRIDNDLGYFKENCRWATYKEQARNRTTNRKILCFNEKYDSINSFVERYDLGLSAVQNQLGKGLSAEEIITKGLCKKKPEGSKTSAKIPISFNGEEYVSISAFAKTNGFNVNRTQELYRNGMTIENIYIKLMAKKGEINGN